jgi:hypothetical protein
MQITGEWYLGDDGLRRPVIRGEVLARDGVWVRVPFLVDTGADQTVLSGSILANLHLDAHAADGRLGGIGGVVVALHVDTQIRLFADNGQDVLFHGRFAASSDLETLDMSVLGRDVTDLFAVIVDRPGDTVLMLSQRHSYRVEHR